MLCAKFCADPLKTAVYKEQGTDTDNLCKCIEFTEISIGLYC